jgi:uncharacterized protein YkwD
MTLAVGLSLLALLNGARAQGNEPPLRLDPVLTAAAEVKANEIERCGFEHDACGRPWDAELPRRAWLGENIGSGYPSVRSVFTGWIDSPGHRANIMRPEFTRVGFARIGSLYVAEFSS